MSSSNYERNDRRHRSRSKSRSKSRHYRHDDYNDDYDRRSYSRSRSRSRSIDRHKRRHHDSPRSRSRDYDSRRDYDRRRDYDSRRGYNSRSRSRSSHRSHKRRNSRHRSGSRTSKTSARHVSRRSSRSSSIEKDHKKRHSSVEETDSRRSKNDETLTNNSFDQENSSTQYFSSNTNPDNLENLPLPEQAENSNNASYGYYVEPDEPIDKERIHREMEEKLRAALAKEGKVYPPPKPEASHPVFANDGSFLEIFKKMQEAQTATVISTPTTMTAVALPVLASTSVAATASTSFTPKPAVPPPPMVGRRRGGKILKTGLVAKPKVTAGGNEDKDFWSLYLAEVNKYKNNACESDGGNRPLLK